MNLLDKTFLAYCLEDENGINKAVEYGFDEEQLSTEEGRKAWAYMMEIKSGGGVPSPREVADRFSVKLETMPDETLEGVCRRLRTRAYTRDLRPHIDEALGKIAEGSPDSALSSLLQASQLRHKYSTKEIAIRSYRQAWEQRLKKFIEIREAGGYVGPVSRWDTLNNKIRGFQDGFLHVLAAGSGLGKSWLLMLLVQDFLQQGRRPLIMSAEMDPMRLAYRLDSLRYDIPYYKIKNADMTDPELEDWMGRMARESAIEHSDAFFIGKADARTVPEVQLIAQDVGATDVFVDGGYRLAKSREWKHQAPLVEEYQVTAELSKIPWIVTNQLGGASDKSSWDKDGKKMKQGSLRYAMEWLTEPDIVLLFTQDEEQKARRIMNCDISKVRDGDGVREEFLMHWDQTTGDYGEVRDEYSEFYDETELVSDFDDDDEPF